MRCLWISFLMIGSITWAQQGFQTSEYEYPVRWPSAGQAPETPERPSVQFGFSGRYNSYPVFYYGSNTNPGEKDDSSSGFVGQESSSQDSQHEATDGGSPYQVTEESWSSSTGAAPQDEPIFTPVDEEDKVYAYKSSSRYNKKRLFFSQTHYNPTETLYYQEPMYPQSPHRHKDIKD